MTDKKTDASGTGQGTGADDTEVAGDDLIVAIKEGRPFEGVREEFIEKTKVAIAAVKRLQEVRSMRVWAQESMATQERLSALWYEDLKHYSRMQCLEYPADLNALARVVGVLAIDPSNLRECDFQASLLPMWAAVHQKPVNEVRDRFLAMIDERRKTVVAGNVT